MAKGPKLKTHKGAKKRFNFTATGKVRRAKGMKSHFRRRKSPACFVRSIACTRLTNRMLKSCEAAASVRVGIQPDAAGPRGSRGGT